MSQIFRKKEKNLVVEAEIKNLSTRYNSVQLEDQWYKLGDFDATELKRGEKYRFIIEDGIVKGIEKLIEEPISEVGVQEEASKESPDVWAMKDWRITRLAAIDRAIQYLNCERSVKDKENFDLEDVLKVADIFVEYAYKGEPPF